MARIARDDDEAHFIWPRDNVKPKAVVRVSDPALYADIPKQSSLSEPERSAEQVAMLYPLYSSIFTRGAESSGHAAVVAGEWLRIACISFLIENEALRFLIINASTIVFVQGCLLVFCLAMLLTTGLLRSQGGSCLSLAPCPLWSPSPPSPLWSPFRCQPPPRCFLSPPCQPPLPHPLHLRSLLGHFLPLQKLEASWWRSARLLHGLNRCWKR
jgi:hypothetical protein